MPIRSNTFDLIGNSGGSQSSEEIEQNRIRQAEQVTDAVSEQLVAYKQKAIEELYNMNITLTTDEYNGLMGASSIAEVDAVIEQVSVRIANEIEQQQQEQDGESRSFDDDFEYTEALIPVDDENWNQGGGQNGGGAEVTIIDGGEIVDNIVNGGGEIIEGGGSVDAQKQEGLSTGMIVGGGVLIGLGIFAFMKYKNK